MKFQVEFPSGKTEVVEQSDCDTVEQFINCRFGRNVKPQAKVTVFGAEPAAEEAKQAKPPAKGKK